MSDQLSQRRPVFQTQETLPPLFKKWQKRPARCKLIVALQANKPLTLVKQAVAVVQQVDDAYQQFIRTHLDPLLGRKRAQLALELQTNASGSEGEVLVERGANRRLGYAVIIGTSGILGTLVAPIFKLIAVPFFVVLAFWWLGETIADWRERRVVGYAALNCTGWTLGLLSGQFVLFGSIMTCFYFSRKLLYIVEDHAQQHLVSGFAELPSIVWRLEGEVEVSVPLAALGRGDVIVVGAGEIVAADGTIVQGSGLIDQHMLTGESQPVEKAEGDPVFASTLVIGGRIYVAVNETGKHTLTAQIIDALNATASYQTTVQAQGHQIADKTASYLVAGASASLALFGPILATAVAFVPLGYPALIASPITMLSFLNAAAARGILIKDGRSLELLAQVDTVVFDKTGTLTLDQPKVGHIHTFAKMPEDEVLCLAAAIEVRQSHPIARAIIQAAQDRGLSYPEVVELHYDMGLGIRGVLDETTTIQVGSARYMTQRNIDVPTEVEALQQASDNRGASLIFVACNQTLIGALEIVPTYRPEATAIIADLKGRGIEVVIISGDHEGPTRTLAQSLGITHYYANTLPENKAELVQQLRDEGRMVCFVGDGINDGIALKTAQVSISIQGSTNVAIQSAQIVLMDSTLTQLPYLFDLSQRFDRNMKLGMTLAVVPGTVMLGGIFLFGWGLLIVGIGANVVILSSVALGMLPLLQEQVANPSRLLLHS